MRRSGSRFFLLIGLLLLGGLGRIGSAAESALDPSLQKWRDQAQQYYDAGDTETGHQALAKGVAALPPGRAELAAEWLGALRRASMADRRMNRWTEYAAERLVALHQAGLLDETNPEVAAAYDCLCVVRWDQGRLWESWKILQDLLALNLDNPYARLAPVRLLIHVDSTTAVPLMQSALDTVDGSGKNDQTRDWLIVAERILSDPGAFEHIPLLDPFRQGFTRARFWSQSNQEILDDMKSSLARRRQEQPAQAWALPPSAPTPAELPALRQVQEAQYQKRIRARSPAPRAGRELLTGYRQSPWSQTANQDLLVQAQADLQRGRLAAARRSFDDILRHAPDPATRQAAQVGLWLAAASETQTAALDALFANVEPAALFPWMGKQETAAAIKARLLQGMPATDRNPPKLAELEPRLVRLPAVPAWPADTLSIQNGASLADLQAHGNRILVGTRRWLAGYDVANPSAPLWLVSDPALPSNPPGEPPLPGDWRPALAFGRLYARGGETNNGPAQVRALDADNGRTLWKTIGAQQTPLEGDAAREFHSVCADPVIDGACLYYTEWAGDQGNPGESRWDIVCASADNGALIWRSTVADASADPAADRLFRELPVATRHLREVPIAMRQRGNPLTVADGAVFFGHAGLAARLDARDGFVEWVRTYRNGMAVASLRTGLAAAPGTPPLVAGERVIFTARDGAALFATDRKTGQLLWEQVFIQPLELLGATKDLVVVRTTVNRLAGIALDTGAVRWTTPIPADPVGRGTVRGDVITLGSYDALLSLDAAGGTVRERRAWPDGKTVWNYALAGKNLVLVTDETAPVAAYTPGTILNPNSPPLKHGPLGLPLTHAWDRPCTPRTRLFTPPAGSPLKGRVFVAEDGMLEALDVAGRGRSAWRRFTRGTVSQILFDQATLVLCSGADPDRPGVQAAMAVDGRTGAVLWRLPVYLAAAGVTMSDGVFVMVNADAEIRAYDAATGRPLWNRLVLRTMNMNPNWRNWPTPPLAQAGQLHLLGARLQPAWEPGIPYPRFDLRTGALLPLKWIAKGEANTINSIQSCIGTQAAFAQVNIRKRDAPPRLYRCMLAEGGATQEVPGANQMRGVGGPYVVAGTGENQNGKLLSGDDPAYEFPLDLRNLVTVTEGLLLQNEKDGVGIIDLGRKQRISGMNTATEKIGNPRLLKLDDARVLFHGISETTVTNTVVKTFVVKEMDRRTGQILRQGSVPDLDVTRNELRGVLIPPQGDVLLVQDNRALHAYVTELPPEAPPAVEGTVGPQAGTNSAAAPH